MSGYAYDTSTLRLSVELPDGSHVDITGANDGVNGYEWSACLALPDDPGAVSLPIKVTEDVLIDGVDDPDDPDKGELLRQRATCSKCLARTYRGEECVCDDGGDAEDYDDILTEEDA